MPSYKVTNSDTFSRDGAYHNYGYKSEKVRKNHDDNDNLPTYAEVNGRRRENGHSRSKSISQSPSRDDNEDQERGEWGSKAEFILSCVGYSVGIGNVWRFPYLAYKNGGGAFLIPYFILLMLVGKPMYYMETAIGQFARLSPLQIWRCAPIATGVGVGMLILCVIVAVYYNVIMAYSIVYVGASFRGVTEELPWAYCGEWWGADHACVSIGNLTDRQKQELTLQRCNQKVSENCTNLQTSGEQFWEKYILGLGPGLQELGDLNGWKYDLPLALALSWILVFLCLCKGVKSSGKVVYFTATFPYAVLIALLVRGVTLPGAVDGIWYLFVPKWEKLLDPLVWKDAASQMFFSLGISWGGLIMFGSYNKFNNKIHYDAAFISTIDFFSSIISSVVVFSVLGHLSHQLGVGVEHVAKGGQGLAFIAYPEALSSFPSSSLPWLWSVLFFLMLFFLGIDSEFAFLETIFSAIYDAAPSLRKHKILITAIGCLCCFLLGLPCVSSNGQYVLDLMDTYGAGFAVLWIAIWEMIAIMWIYGASNFSKDIKLMIGSEPMMLTKICWVFLCPVILLIILAMSLYYWKDPVYGGEDGVPYPYWGHWIGWILVGLSACQVHSFINLLLIHFKKKSVDFQVFL